jgi:hypothetical protein
MASDLLTYSNIHAALKYEESREEEGTLIRGVFPLLLWERENPTRKGREAI